MTLVAAYNSYLTTLADGTIDYLNDTIVCLLATDSYSPSVTSHSMISHVTAEVAGGGYARQTLAGKTRLYDAAAGKMRLDCSDPLFPNLTASAVRYAIFAKDDGPDSSSPLMFYWDFQTRYNLTGNDFKVVLNASGLFTLSVA